jgi:arylsulfatase A-like enzyme
MGSFRRLTRVAPACFIVLTALAAPALPPARAAEKAAFPSCEGCNVILLSVDTLRADALSAYGYGRETSPNLDRLASRGVVFLNDFSQFPVTLSSHMSMFTSQYPWVHRVRTTYVDQLSTGTVTLPMALRAHGYRTVWAAMVNDPNLSLSAGFGRGFDDLVPPVDSRREWTSRAFAWLEGHSQQRFFMFLHTYRTHDPYAPEDSAVLRFIPSLDPGKRFDDESAGPRAERELYDEIESTGSTQVLPQAFLAAHAEALAITDPVRRRQVLEPLLQGLDDEGRQQLGTSVFLRVRDNFWKSFDLHNASDVAYARTLYDAAVYQADQGIGALYAKLEALGIADKTLLVITSDHGEEFMEHGRVTHTQDYVELMHVPLIVVFPGRRLGLRIPQVVRSIDIMPTILDALRLPAPPRIQGRSLRPLIAGDEDAARYSFAQSYISYSVRDARFTYNVKNQCAAADGPSDPRCLVEEFFDRDLDPGEKNNLYADSSLAARHYRAVLMDRLERDNAGIADPWLQGLSQRARERLIKSGYW